MLGLLDTRREQTEEPKFWKWGFGKTAWAAQMQWALQRSIDISRCCLVVPSDCGLELVWRITWVIAQPWPVSRSWQPGYSDTKTSLVQTQGFAAHAFCQSQGSVCKSLESLDSCRQGSLLERIFCFSILHHVTQHVTDNDLLHLDTIMPEFRDHCSIRSSV